MLTYMRSKSKTWVKWIIFSAIAVVFIFWGGSAYWGSNVTRIAKIDRTIITPQQYNKAYEDALKNLQTKLGTYPTPEMVKQLGLKTKVLDQLIDEYIIASEAERMKISVTDDELQKAIRGVPAFQQQGQFSADNYRRFLSYQRLTPKDFEEMQRNDLVKLRLYNLVTENVIVSPEEAASFYKYKYDTYSLNYLTIDPRSFMKDVTVTDQEAGIYYDKNKDKYKVPPKVVLSYMAFPVERYVDKVTVTSEDVSDYYASNRDEFSAKPKVHGRHILIRVPRDASAEIEEEKRGLARKIYEEAKSGVDFAELARKYSEDPGTSSIGGDLGLVLRDSLPEPMGTELFKAGKGDLIQPVRTALGFHVLKSEGKEEAKSATVEEVAPLITEKLKLQRSKIMAGDDANNSFREIYEQGNTNLEAYARTRGLEVKEIGPFSQGDDIGIAGSDEIMKNAFLYPKGEIGAVVDIKSGFMIYMVKDKIPARTQELGEVKERVVADLKVSKALEIAKKNAESLAKDIQGLNAMAFSTTGDFSRASYLVPQLGMLPGVKDDLDKLAVPKVYTAGDRIYIVWQGRTRGADIRTADKETLRQVKEELLSRKREMAVETFMAEARKRHKIIIDEDKLKDVR